MSIRSLARACALLVCVAACGDSRVAPLVAPVDAPAPVTDSPRRLRLLPVHESAVRGQIDMWMGDTLNGEVDVRVIDAAGRPVAGMPVVFRLARRATRDESRDGSEDASFVSVTDAYGIARTERRIVGVRDTVFADYVVTAVVDSLAVSSGDVVASESANLAIDIRAWRDLSHFGGASTWDMTRLPIDRRAIAAVLPLGTFANDEALPSSEAIVLADAQRLDTRDVVSPSTGLVTDIDRVRGIVTLRVRDQIRVEISRVAVASNVWIGKGVQGGEVIGTLRSAAAGGGTLDSIGVRVLDAAVQRTNYVNPGRYGARRSATFFARYLSDSLRSHVYALVRRAAPDLDGRIDYDRDGKLVGTWFDVSAPRDAALSSSSIASNPSAFASRAGSSVSETDASTLLSRLALTFAYDAERPGQVRIAVGAALLESLGLSGVRAVAWEDTDPAEVGVASGVTRYRLFATDDDSRIGRSGRVLLVQLVDSRTLRVEAVSGDHGESGTFSNRATTLVR